MAANLWFQVPPGWLELAALDDEAADKWLTELIDLTPDLLDEVGEARLRNAYTSARAQTRGFDVASAGALVTTLPDNKVTAWQFAIRVISLPSEGDSAGEINPMRAITQYLASDESLAELGDDQVETFETADGRDGVAIYTTTASDAPERLKENIPHATPGELGVVYAAVRLGRIPDDNTSRIALVSGVSPTVEERQLMAWIVAQIAVTIQVHHENEPAPEGPIYIDAVSGMAASTSA